MKLQEEYCKKKGLPFFAPYDSICFNCHKKIEDNGKELITGCPHCNHSFCN